MERVDVSADRFYFFDRFRGWGTGDLEVAIDSQIAISNGVMSFVGDDEIKTLGARLLAGIKIPRRGSESHSSGQMNFGFARCQVSGNPEITVIAQTFVDANRGFPTSVRLI